MSIDYFCRIVSIIFLLPVCWGIRIAMKVVESPATYGLNNDLISPNTDHNGLSVRVQPQNFSGPEQLKQLEGRCFNKTDEHYQYIFCPFKNITQHEISNRWNAYQGVLGIWKEWKIVNNTFEAMMMEDGDNCGTLHRSVEVSFECSTSNLLKTVAEPSRCEYKAVFQTPLVCHPQAMLVYPRLPINLKAKWDKLETELHYEEITMKGYEKILQEIFVEAGYQLRKSQFTQEGNKNPNNIHSSSCADGANSSLAQCMKEINELRKEIEGLKILLDLKNASSHFHADGGS